MSLRPIDLGDSAYIFVSDDMITFRMKHYSFFLPVHQLKDNIFSNPGQDFVLVYADEFPPIKISTSILNKLESRIK